MRASSSVRVEDDQLRLLEKMETHFQEHDESKAESVILGEMVDAGLLTGEVVRDQNGCIAGSAITGFTLKGRLFLRELRKEKSDASATTRASKAFVFLLGLVAAAAVQLGSEIIKASLTR